MDKDNTAILSDIRQLLDELKQQIACLEVKIDALSVGEQTSGDNDMIDLWLDNSEVEETAVTETDAADEVASEDTDMPVGMEDIPENEVPGQETEVKMQAEQEAEVEVEPEPEQNPAPIAGLEPALEPEEEPEQLLEPKEELEPAFDAEKEPATTFDPEEKPESVFVPQTGIEEERAYEEVFEPATQEEDKIVEETPVDFEPEEDTQNIEEQDIEADIIEEEAFEPGISPEPEVETEPGTEDEAEPEAETEPGTEDEAEPEPDPEDEVETEQVLEQELEQQLEPAVNNELVFEEPIESSEEAASPFRRLEPERSTGVGHSVDSFAGSRTVTDEPADQNPGEIAVEQTESKTEIAAEPQKRPMTIEEMFEAFFNSTEQESRKAAGQHLKPVEKADPVANHEADAFQTTLATEPARASKPEPIRNGKQGQTGRPVRNAYRIAEAVPEEPEKPIGSPDYTTYATGSRRKSLADRLMRSSSENWKTDIPGSPVKDIKSAISLNDRVMMIRSLFDNDGDIFHKTVSEINSMDSLDEAVDYLKANFPSWRWESDNVYKFMMAVRRKLK